MQTLIDVLGWIGTVLYLIAYALVSLKKVEGDSLLYQSINIVTGFFVIGNSFYWRAYPSTALNAVWIGIAIFTLGRRYTAPK